MFKQSIIESIEIKRDGSINLKVGKQIVDDDGTVLMNEWHRQSLPPGSDINKALTDINADLQSKNFAPVAQDEVQKVKNLEPVVWTKEVKDAYAEKMSEVDNGLGDSLVKRST